MKKLVLGIALFGGAFALTNEMVKANTAQPKEDAKVENFKINCSPDGTCSISVYCNGYGNPPTSTHEYSGVTAAWCRNKAAQLQSTCLSAQ